MWAVTALFAVLLAGPAVRAQSASVPAAAAPASQSDLRAERDRLRQALDSANREISELKRSSRGVTDEYRLRRKLAEAEDLARRLTAAEARLAGPAPKPTAPAGDLDGAPASPNALRARADVMTDDAGRLVEQATRLERAAGQIRRRATLRGRARQLERDPFAGVAGSKRLLIIRGATADLSAGGNSTTRTGSSEGATAGDATTDTGRSSGSQPTVAPTGESAPPPDDSGGAGAASAPPPSGNGPTPTSTATPTPTETPPPPAGPAPQTADPTPTTPTTSARALVDPGTLAELRRLESGGRSLADAERMERLATELHKRARALSDQARTLRDRASER